MGAFSTTADIGVAVWTPLSTISPNKSAAANISLANNSLTDNITVKVAISTTPTADPTSAEIIEPGQVLAPGGVFIRTGEPMKAGETVKVYASAIGISARSSGFER